MAIQISLDAEKNPFKLALSEAYVRLTKVDIDFANETIAFIGGIWASKESRDGGGQPIAGLPPLTIQKAAQEAQFQMKGDPQTGRPELDQDGKPILIQVAPSLPSFAECLAAIKTAVKADADYRAFGYALLKRLDLIKQSSPLDV